MEEGKESRSEEWKEGEFVQERAKDGEGERGGERRGGK